jgi:hypothetical protein
MKKVRIALGVGLAPVAMAALPGIAIPAATAATQQYPAINQTHGKSVRVGAGQAQSSPSLAPHACVANIPVTTYSSYGYMQFWWKHSGASTCVGTVERIFTQTQFNGRVRLRIWEGHHMLLSTIYYANGHSGNHVVRRTFPYGVVGVCTAVYNSVYSRWSLAICNNAG